MSHRSFNTHHHSNDGKRSRYDDDDNDSYEMKFREEEERAEAAAMKRRRVADPLTSTTTPNNNNNNNNNEEFHPIKLFATLHDEQDRLPQAHCGFTTEQQQKQQQLRRTYCWTLREMLALDVHPHNSSSPHPSATTTTTSSIDWIVIANYIIDFDFLLQEIPELVSFPRVVIFYGHADNNEIPWDTSSKNGFNSIVLCRRCPSDPPRSQHNPLPFRIPYGVHHTKLFLIGYSNGTIRVVIHTANLRYNDIHLKTQGAYLQDFALKPLSLSTTTAAAPTTTKPSFNNNNNDFEEALVSYVGTYGHNKSYVWDPPTSASTRQGAKSESCTLTQLLRRYDFSTANAILIPSTPGYHPISTHSSNNSGSCHVGHLRLRHVLATSNTTPSKAMRSDNHSNELLPQRSTESQPKQQQQPRNGGSIICQFSSIGSLTESWLRELELSMDINARSQVAQYKQAAKVSSKSAHHHPPCKLRLVYPTVEEIRNSVEGYRGGGSVPGTTKNVSKPFLRPLYHKWSSSTKLPVNHHRACSNPTATLAVAAAATPTAALACDVFQRSCHVPHIKTYYQLTPDCNGMEWFVLTSHNLSKAAWGEVIRSRQHQNEQRLFIRHWELGVLIMAPKTATHRLLRPVDEDDNEDDHEPRSLRIPLPYQPCPEPYRKNDHPWAVDGVYPFPDSLGNMCGG